jgi:hypothetical protein
MQKSLETLAIPPYNQGDFILLSDTPKNVSNNICTKKLLLEAKLIEAKAGDLILWDSRLIHGGKVGLGKPIVGSTPGKAYDLLRLAVPICLMPRNGVSEEILEERREAYMKRYTMNHWANEVVYCICNDTHAINITKEPSIHNLTKEEKELL